MRGISRIGGEVAYWLSNFDNAVRYSFLNTVDTVYILQHSGSPFGIRSKRGYCKHGYSFFLFSLRVFPGASSGPLAFLGSKTSAEKKIYFSSGYWPGLSLRATDVFDKYILCRVDCVFFIWHVVWDECKKRKHFKCGEMVDSSGIA